MINILEKIRNFPFIKQVIKFCVVGFSSALINFAVFVFATKVFSVWYIYSSIIAYILSAIFNFITNKLWTFRNPAKGREAVQQAGKFTLVIVIGLSINTLIIYFLTDSYGLDFRLSWVVATAVVVFWNFSFNRFWTFRHKKPPVGLSIRWFLVIIVM